MCSYGIQETIGHPLGNQKERSDDCLAQEPAPTTLFKKKLDFPREAASKNQVFSRGLSAIMTKLGVSEGMSWPKLFASMKWESRFFGEHHNDTQECK